MSSEQSRIRQARESLESSLSGKPVTRAGFLAGSGVGLAAFLAACGSSGSSSSSSTGTTAGAGTTASAGAPTSGPTDVTYVKGGTLNIYSWPEYFAPADTKAWAARTGAKLNVSSYQSNDELFAKLSTAAGRAYDIVIPTSSFVQAMASRGMLQKLDQSRIPWQNLERSLLGKVFDPKNEYSIPKDFGTGGVIYDPTAIGGEIVTWQDFFDAIKKPGVSGRVRYSDDAQGGLGPGLWTLGYNYDSNVLAQWSKAAHLIKSEVMPHVKSIGNLFDTDPITSGQIVATIADNSVARRAIMRNPKLRFVLPRPHCELWVDNYAITKNASDTDAAYSFLQYMLQPSVQVAETKVVGYGYPLPNLQRKLGDFPLAELVFPTAAQFEYMQSSVIYPSIQGQIQDMWSKVRASS